MEKKLINRKTYKEIKKMDRQEMETFLARIYHQGYQKDRLFVGKVIYKTDRYTVFEGVNYRESFLNWNLERLLVKEVSC